MSRKPIIRYRERRAHGVIIHAGPAEGMDMTLCGYAFEGACDDATDDEAVEEVTRGKVSCRQCLAIIWFGKGYPARLLARGNR